jgi:beta-galactosidase
LSFFACLNNDVLWAEQGFVVAKEQFALSDFTGSNLSRDKAKKLKIKKQNDRFRIIGKDFVVTISKHNGALLSYVYRNKEYLVHPLEPYFWKPPNDNQERNKYTERLGAWKMEVGRRKVYNIHIDRIHNQLKVHFYMKLGKMHANYHLQYTIDQFGKVKVEANYEPLSDVNPPIPKFGFRLAIPEKYAEIEWYGRGPHENYPDRKSGALLGLYRLNLNDFITPYISPQDNSNRCDVRKVKFTNESGEGIIVEGIQPFSFRAWPYLEDDLEAVRHNYEILRRNFINVNIDYKIHGVGGDDSWGARTHKEYTIDGRDPLTCSFMIAPVHKD